MSNFKEIRSVSAEVFHTDRLTDMTQLTIAFRYCVNVSKKVRIVNNYCGKYSQCKK